MHYVTIIPYFSDLSSGENILPILLRRRNLGRTSCREIKSYSTTGFKIVKTWKQPFPDQADIVFRWGCTTEVPDGINIINKADAVSLVADKSRFRAVLNEQELCPETFFSLQEALEQPRIDFVVRPRIHSRGRRIYRCRTPEELTEAVTRCGPGFYISEYIDKVAEYRVFIAQGRVVWVAKKTPGNPDDLAWNVARGGRFDNVSWEDWPLKVIKIAVKAHDLSGLDFSGVDAMLDKDGNVYILELNAAPSQTSPYRQQCVAKAFDWIVRNGKEKVPLIEEKGGWKKWAHPCLSNQVRVP